MSCVQTHPCREFRAAVRSPDHWAAIPAAIAVIADIMREAFDMRRAAHRKYRLNDE